MMLGTTNKWFNSIIMHESVWKFACLRDLQVPSPPHVSHSWIKLYASAFGNMITAASVLHTIAYDVLFISKIDYVIAIWLMNCFPDGSHSYLFRQQEKHIGKLSLATLSR